MKVVAGSGMWAHLSDYWALFLFCFVGGYIDAAGWLGLFGLFTGSITGNLVAAGAAVVYTVGVIPRVIVSGVYVGGAALGGLLWSLLTRRFSLPPRRAMLWLLCLELASLGTLWVSGALLLPTLVSINSPNVSFVGSMAALAMGVQAIAVKEGMPGSPSTNVMTTTLSNCGSLIGAALVAAVEDRAAARTKVAALAKTFMPVFAFVCGVCLGAALQYYINFNSTCVPVAIVLLLIMELAMPLNGELALPLEGAAVTGV
jgi:uncharacterized membrane protein YoaK (UPF0700 family)